MTAKPGTTSTADRILDAAIGLMNTKGYNPVSVREIAKAVGLSEMTVFRHFPSKYANAVGGHAPGAVWRK